MNTRNKIEDVVECTEDTNVHRSALGIHDAVREGNLEIVKALLAENAELVDLKDEKKQTPLHAAAQKGHLDIAAFLISQGADVNANDHMKRTPLFEAVFAGHNEIVELLPEKGADFNTKDYRGGSAMHWAAGMGKKEVVRLFIKKGGKPTLHEAAACNFQEIIQQYLKDGDDVNRLDTGGMAPMHWAAQCCAKESIDLLLAHGADINIKTKNDKTPLDMAIERGIGGMVRLLISKGGKETPVKDPEIAHLSKNIYRMTFPHGLRSNITVFTGPDGILLVDTGLSKRYINKIKAILLIPCESLHKKQVFEMMSSRKESPRAVQGGLGGHPILKKTGQGDIKYIINTHLDQDHVGGNSIAGDHTKIIDFKRLEKIKDHGFLSKANGSLKGRNGKTFETYYTMNVNGEEIHLIPFPGLHSDEDMMVHFTRSGIACMGDLLLNGSFPAVDENVFEYLELLEKVIDIFPMDTTFICGHGPELTKKGLTHLKKMILETMAIVEEKMREGKTVDDMLKEDILKKYESWGTFIKKTDYWITTLYMSIAKSKT